MLRARWLYVSLSSIVLLLSGGLVALRSQTSGRERIREAIDETRLVTLYGNTRSEAIPANDLGAVADDFRVDHMLLQLKRSPQQERAVEKLIADLHNPASPAFHKWLSAQDFGSNYGVAGSDVATITRWLESQGFTVNLVYPSGMLIDFSGNAGQVRRAFHTSIHNLTVNGVPHIANFSNPEIPAALAPAVAGIVAMHDFRPHKMIRAKAVKSAPQYTFTSQGSTLEAVVPADLATIYDFNPLFAKGVTGTGQTVAVIEDTELYKASDWTTFRSTFGLSQYTSGSLTSVNPQPPTGAPNCTSPGITGDDNEAILDVEWATAAAPGAAIVNASCANTGVASGLFLAAQNLVNATSPPSILSISYGACEAESGAASNASINALYQQAVAEGISVFVAAGDEGAASCDPGETSATHGLGVSANATTPYNVAVGGTDFSDSLTGTNSTYWSKTNTATYGSALSYIPEIPWNDSCAGSLLSGYLGYSTGYGGAGFCNSQIAKDDLLQTVAAASGGPSSCASGAPSTSGVVSGTCQGYAKPSWQTGLAGIPSDGVRDIPDVSMFAADGIWGHYSVVCFSDRTNGGAPCTGAPSSWAGFGGTSVATPVVAGIQALVNQNTGSKQGNPNVVYYALAKSQPSVFHAISQGDIDVNCSGPRNCYGVIGTVGYGRGGRIFGTTYGGALSISSTSFTAAYSAGAPFSLANGLGSIDVYNLVTNWGQSQ
jgi:subtilase family serine protease